MIPKLEELPNFPVTFRTDPVGFQPYKREPKTLSRPWAVPGTPGLEHRIGGLEKQDVTGNVNYEPMNHEHMVHLRAEKVAGIVQDIPDVVPEGDAEGDLLIIGWGSTYGSITAAVRSKRAAGKKIGQVHLRYLNPLPKNVGEVMARYKKVLVPEMNLGQLVWVLRAKFLVTPSHPSPGKPSWFRMIEPRLTRSSSERERPYSKKDLPRPTRRCAGARAAGTTPSWPPCSRSSPSWDPAERFVVFRDRLLQPLPVLHEHLRLPHHSRAGARRGHGPQAGRGRTSTLGRHR
jgi:hypothetical protein